MNIHFEEQKEKTKPKYQPVEKVTFELTQDEALDLRHYLGNGEEYGHQPPWPSDVCPVLGTMYADLTDYFGLAGPAVRPYGAYRA